MSSKEFPRPYKQVIAGPLSGPRSAAGARLALAAYGLPLGLAAFVAACVLRGGVPALRHDWRIPIQPESAGPWLASLFEGWLPAGIGSAQPYPTFYFVGFALWPFHGVFSSLAITATIIALTVALASYAALSVVRTLGGPWPAAVAAAIFAALNPWVYAKYVAGHILMIFAYAVLLALVAEVLRSKPRRWVVILLAAFSITQLEFFLVAALPLLVWSLARREQRVFAVVIAAAAPIAYGIAASYRQIQGTPFNLAWQQDQSLHPWSALLLGDFSLGYPHAFAQVLPAVLILTAFSLSGLFAAFRRRGEGLIAACGACGWLLSTGTRGPIAPAYDWLVLHFSEVGVFRELYDLSAIVAICYIVLLARGLARIPALSCVLALAAAAYAVPWLRVPPSSFFVGAQDIPQAPVPADPATRVAFLPAFQPLQLGDTGSGVDPDAYVRTGYALPLNEFFPAFPVDAALAYAAFRGDDRRLAGLGATQLIARPYLQTNLHTLGFVWAETKPVEPRAQRSRSLPGIPLLSVGPLPAVATIANDPNASAVFFGDLSPQRIHAFGPTRATKDAAADWVDARLAIPAHPDWGTAFGGVLTTSANALPLPLPAAGTALLAQTDGRLLDDRGRIVAMAGDGLHWHPLATGARAVRCAGTCVVILQAEVPPRLPEDGAPLHARALDVTFITPWLARAHLPASTNGMLRLNVRYDPAWYAYGAGRALDHERLDTAFNGWKIATNGPLDLVFVERTAAAQFLLELAAAALLLALLGLEIAGYYGIGLRASAKSGAA